jgi:hypothetical protein
MVQPASKRFVTEATGPTLFATAGSAWKPNTDYKASQIVTNGGLIYIANLDHLSGPTTITLGNWTAIGGGGGTNLIVETSTGVWSGDAPARTVGQYPIIFSGTSDPADPTNGIATPSRINAGDIWLEKL